MQVEAVCFKCGGVGTPENAIQGTRSNAVIHIECLDDDLKALYQQSQAKRKDESK